MSCHIIADHFTSGAPWRAIVVAHGGHRGCTCDVPGHVVIPCGLGDEGECCKCTTLSDPLCMYCAGTLDPKHEKLVIGSR